MRRASGGGRGPVRWRASIPRTAPVQLRAPLGAALLSLVLAGCLPDLGRFGTSGARDGGKDAASDAASAMDGAARDGATDLDGQVRVDGGIDGGRADSGDGLDGGADAAPLDAAHPDAGVHDASRSDAGADGGATGLDPDISTVGADAGEPCETPGSLGECGSLDVCRFHSPEQGRCASCDACRNLGDPCTKATDCDIVHACYRGRCTNHCRVGTYDCGPIENCHDVGHPTHGACWPP